MKIALNRPAFNIKIFHDRRDRKVIESVTNLLKTSIIGINNLQEYYLYQAKSVSEHIENNLSKFTYGIALDLYFFYTAMKMEDENFNEEFFISESMLLKIKETFVDKIIDKYQVQKDENGARITYKLKNVDKLSSQYELNPYLASIGFNNLVKQPDILNESTLIMLLVKYEETIASVYRFLIENYPQAYLNDKSITYAELLNLDIEQIKLNIIDKAVEAFMRLPLSEWYKTFSDKHKINFSFNNTFDEFKEIYYRRNLVVHNQKRVNEAYIKNCKDNSKKIGDVLNIDDEYMTKSFDVVLMVIYETFFGLRKLFSSKYDDSMTSFVFEQGYDHMVKQQWSMSKFIFDLLSKEKNQNLAEQLCNKINYLISVKNLEGLENIFDEVKRLDVSAMQGQYLVAKYALLDDFDNVSKTLEKIINKEIPVNYVKEWPLFLQYRESDEYKKFQKEHKELFEIQAYEPPDELRNDEKEVIDKITRDCNTIQE